MEKPKPRGTRNMMKTNVCMPRFRTNATSGGGGGRNNHRRWLSPMSVLDRLREAVFRLIMLSALSKATATHQTGGGGDRADRSSSSSCSSCYYYPQGQDPHHNEAVADCIEFIKKSATAEEGRESTASSNSIDVAATPEVLFPLPVYM